MSDTSTLAAFERVFDTGGMSVAPTPATAAADAVTDARALTQKLSRSLGIPTATALIDQARPRPVGSALAGLFARGGLPQGEVVSLSGRAVLSLALACCAETTRDGGWCAGIGLGAPAASAMRDLGIDLSRFVCLDTPAQDWMRVTSILLESFDVLVVDPGFSASAGDRARIAAKLRDSRATLILLKWSWSSEGRSERAWEFVPRKLRAADSPRGILGGDGSWHGPSAQQDPAPAQRAHRRAHPRPPRLPRRDHSSAVSPLPLPPLLPWPPPLYPTASPQGRSVSSQTPPHAPTVPHDAAAPRPHRSGLASARSGDRRGPVRHGSRRRPAGEPGRLRECAGPKHWASAGTC